MASFLIPNRYFGISPAAEHFFQFHPNYEVVMSRDGWVDSDALYVPDRCRCPVHSPAGPVRRRRDLHRVLKESVLGESSPPRSPREREGFNESLFGIPVEFIHLVDRLTGRSRSTGNKDRENCDQSCKDSGRVKKTTANQEKLSASSSTGDKESSTVSAAVAKSNDPFAMSIGIGDYEPGNVNISVDGRLVTVKAKHDRRGDSRSWVRHSEIEYSFLVPENTDTASLTSSYGVDGTLSITAKRKSNSTETAIESPKEQRSEQTTEVGSEMVADDTEEGSRDKALEDIKTMEAEMDVIQESSADDHNDDRGPC